MRSIVRGLTGASVVSAITAVSPPGSAPTAAETILTVGDAVKFLEKNAKS